MEHTNMLLYDQRILKLPDVVNLKTGIIMFKAFDNVLPVNVQQFFSIYMSRLIQPDRIEILNTSIHVPLLKVCAYILQG